MVENKLPKIYKNFGYRWYCGGCPTKTKENGVCKCKNVCNAPQKICLREQKKDEKIMKYCYENRHGWTLVKEKDLIEMVKSNNAFFMEILNQYPKKAYFDIDGKDPNKLSLKIVKEIINKYFPDAKMAISGSETDEKKSYHIILPEYILEDNNDLLLMRKLVKLIHLNECEFFDWKVYTPNRAFKCINQSKPNKAIQAIIEDTNEKNHFISSFITGKEKKIKIELPEDLPQIELNLNELPTLKEPLKLNKDFTKDDLNDNLKLLKLAPNGEQYNHAYTWKVAMFCFNNGLSFDDFWDWSKTKDKSESRKLKWKNTHWNTISNSDFRMSKKGFIMLLSFYYPELENVESDNDYITKKFINSLDIPSTKIDTITQEHFKTKNKCVIFNIGMGGGKTTQTVNYLEESNKSFIWLAPRQALVMNTFERFQQKKMNVLNYLNCGSTKEVKIKKINKSDKLLLEAESLNKIENTKKYDILIIDEIETVLKNWDSETHIKNHIDINFNNFIELFNNCKQIILLDAFTTTATTDLLNQLNIKYITYSSLYKPKEKRIIENFGYEKTIDKIAKELDDGKKLYIFHAYKSSTKKHYSIEELKSVLLEKCNTKPKILVYHGDMNDDKKKSLYNVNEEWDKYDCILTTSSITVGVNYEGKKYDKVYLMVSGCVNNVRDVIQTSMRIRQTKDNAIELYFFDRMDKVIYKYPEYYQESKNDIYKKLVDNIAIEKQANFIESLYKFCNLTNYKPENIKKYQFFKSDKFINTLYESKMLMPYSKIDELNDTDAQNIEINNVWQTNATQIQKFQVNKYYFDLKFRKLSYEDKEFIWDNRLINYFANINDPLISLLVKDNKMKNLNEINYNKIELSEETEKYINENYKSSIKNKNQKIVKILNSLLSCELITIENKSENSKATKYAVSELAEQLQEIYLTYTAPNKKEQVDIFDLFDI